LSAVVVLAVLTAAPTARAALFEPVEGVWRARATKSLPLSFEVHDGQVENVRFVYSAGPCGNFESTGPNVVPIRAGGSWEFRDGKGPKIEANFVTDDRVEGIVFVPSTDSPGCPETEAHFVAAPGEAPPPPPPDTTAPKITGLRVIHGRAAYRLSESAKVSFLLEVRRPGRVVGQNCLAVTRANRGHRPCSLWLPRGGTFAGPGGPGHHSVAIPGAAALVPGAYRLTATATDRAGNVGAATRRFVVRRGVSRRLSPLAGAGKAVASRGFGGPRPRGGAHHPRPGPAEVAHQPLSVRGVSRGGCAGTGASRSREGAVTRA
jgi:hypothetical protein